METETPARPATWHLDVWFEGEQYEKIRELSERWNCSLEAAVRRMVQMTEASAEPA